MELYIVESNLTYEASTLIGVFSTLEKAVEVAEAHSDFESGYSWCVYKSGSGQSIVTRYGSLTVEKIELDEVLN